MQQIGRGYEHLIDDFEAALRNVSNRVCDECASDLSDGSGFCATCDNFTMPSDFYLRWVRRTQMEAALNAERERHCRLLCKWCGDEDYDLRWHHEEWRHYRLLDMHVEYCDAAILRGRGE